MKARLLPFIILYFVQSPLHAVPKDSSGTNKHTLGLDFSYGLHCNFYQFDNVNPKVFGNGKSAYFDNVQMGYLFDLGVHGAAAFMQLELLGSNQDKIGTNSISHFSSKQACINVGYKFPSKKAVSFSGDIGIGAADYSMISSQKNNSTISFDSLLNQTKGDINGKSINLTSNNHTPFVKPEVEVSYLSGLAIAGKLHLSICLAAGYQLFLQPVAWYSVNGQQVNNLPFGIPGTPTVDLKAKLSLN